MASDSQKGIGSKPWASFAAVAWCAVFGAVHLYWALGGTVGFVEFSLPPNKVLALTRDPAYIGITWAVVTACLFGVVAAFAPTQPWSGRIPRWLLLIPLWIAFALFLIRGIGTPIQTALVISGAVPFKALAGPDAQAWRQWLLLDTVGFSPWFILGGVAFGATAWLARGSSVAKRGRDMAAQAQSQDTIFQDPQEEAAA